jgi:hypothetical protein
MQFIILSIIAISYLITAPSNLPSADLSRDSPRTLFLDQTKSKCGDAVFAVESDDDEPASLTIIEAGCERPHYWKAQVDLTNTSDKDIRQYEVAYIGTWEHRKCDWSAEGKSGIELKPGESVRLSINTGFLDGLSYGKPVGSLQGVIFRIEEISLADGVVWKRKGSKKS